MKIDIKHTEVTSGLVFKKTYPAVSLLVVFSEEEKQIIREQKLEKRIVLERGVPADHDPQKYDGMEDVFNLRISSLLNGTDTFAFDSLGDANEYVAVVKEQLPVLKNFLMANSGEAGEESFEL